MQNKYYVYRHIRLDSNIPFYIGKGCKSRAFLMNIRSNYHKNIQNKTKIKVEIIKYFKVEQDALTFEMQLIKLYKKFGYCEANFNLGGDGCSGYKWTLEQKIRHSKLLKSQTKKMRAGQKKRSTKLRGRTKKTHKGLAIISEKNKGENNGRAIWDIVTPQGIFATILEAAKYYNKSTFAIQRRLATTKGQFKDWKKVRKAAK